MTQFRTENPATGEVLQTWEILADAEVQKALAAGHEAFDTWRQAPTHERAQVLARTAEIYDERADEMAEIIAVEMGKPLREGKGEVGLAAAILRYYSKHAETLLCPDELPAQHSRESVVEKKPVGLLLGIMPWNFPYYQVARFAAPNLLLGNTVLLKHAEICARSALFMQEVFDQAGLPAGVYQNIFVSTDQVQDIIADPRVQGVSLTGSEAAGAAVARSAGEHLKKSVLELGGSDAMIVLGGDVKAIARTAGKMRLLNSGQACNSPKRMIVLEEHYDQFVAELTATIDRAVVGDPRGELTTMGPLSSGSALEKLLDQVQDAVDKGATVHTGGERGEGGGSFMQPTVLTDLTPEMRAYTEELFGPVAMVFKATSIDEAVELANDSAFGLSGSVWSDDLELAGSTARRLEVGMALVNEHGTTLPGLPFGGVKRSGFGRELGRYGIDEFVNKKLVRISGR